MFVSGEARVESTIGDCGAWTAYTEFAGRSATVSCEAPFCFHTSRDKAPKTMTANATMSRRGAPGGLTSVNGIMRFRHNGAAAIFVLRIKAHARAKVNAFLSINLWKLT